LRDETLLLPWINMIAINCHRRAAQQERLVPFSKSELPPAAVHNPTATHLAAIEISRLLDQCDPYNRELLVAQMSGKTAKELALEYGVTPTAMRIRLMRARRAARVALDQAAAARRHSVNAAGLPDECPAPPR
jgi:DNA-directed RNA polymerase specialized sigma24 family protein